ncbi:hypothetical protein FA15DRAFT_702711 [Coprinopsis marcescibilis]|uniref:DUF6533 domain-containing protein n=1 Tax=Coprinopsis marcescibilis TaxID=230819 RepID=A0A5C3L345_COPMA|nr:hypothetical protein FA15DRAFT_702711 [Coprinopsis marcescibilis]
METPLNVPVELIRSFELFRVVKYMQVVSFSIFLCDYLQMLELEIAVVWQTKWGIGNILYLFSRLLPFFDVPLVIFYRLYPNVPTLPNRVCDVLYKIETWCTVLGIFASEIMLVMMIYALTSNKIIRWWLIGQTVTVGSAACVTLGIFSASLQFGEAPLPIPTGCLLVGGKFIFAGVGFIILALNQFSLMVIVLGVGVARYRHSNSTLVKVLYRDGVFYYVFLFLVSAAEVVVLLLAPSELSDLLTT